MITVTKNSKYLGVVFNKYGGESLGEIDNKINKDRVVTRAANGQFWMDSKLSLYTTLLGSVVLYCAEVWDVSARSKLKLMATEIMDFHKRSCLKTIWHREGNDVIMNRIKVL